MLFGASLAIYVKLIAASKSPMRSERRKFGAARHSRSYSGAFPSWMSVGLMGDVSPLKVSALSGHGREAAFSRRDFSKVAEI